MANPFKDALIEYTDKAVADKKLEILNALKTNWAKDSLAALPRNAGIGALIGAGINGTRGAIKGWRDAAAKTTIKPRNLWIPEQVVPASFEDKVVGALRRGSIDALKGAGVGAGIGAATSPLSPVVSAALRYRAEPMRIQGITDVASQKAQEFVNLARAMANAAEDKFHGGSISDSLAADLKARYKALMNDTFMQADTKQQNLAMMSAVRDMYESLVPPPPGTLPSGIKFGLGLRAGDRLFKRKLKGTFASSYRTPELMDQFMSNMKMSPIKDMRHYLKELDGRIFKP